MGNVSDKIDKYTIIDIHLVSSSERVGSTENVITYDLQRTNPKNYVYVNFANVFTELLKAKIFFHKQIARGSSLTVFTAKCTQISVDFSNLYFCCLQNVIFRDRIPRGTKMDF